MRAHCNLRCSGAGPDDTLLQGPSVTFSWWSHVAEHTKHRGARWAPMVELARSTPITQGSVQWRRRGVCQILHGDLPQALHTFAHRVSIQAPSLGTHAGSQKPPAHVSKRGSPTSTRMRLTQDDPSTGTERTRGGE